MAMLFWGFVMLGLFVLDSRCTNQGLKGPSVGCGAKDSDQETFHPYSCLDYLKRGAIKCGIYKLFDSSGNSYPAYCDLQSEPGSAWTLVLSWSNAYRKLLAFQRSDLKANAPVNENSQNWNMYRLSLARIRSLQRHSTHWRATCSYPTHGVDFKDYVRGKFKDFNIVDLKGGYCKKVEFVNIRGHIGIHLTASFHQYPNTFLHIDSSSIGGCQFNANSGSILSEDNFGFYETINPNFRCTEYNHSTTQWWFGGHL